MLGVAFQATSQAPKQALTFDHTDRLHFNQDREVIEGGVLLQNQAKLCLLLSGIPPWGLKVTGPEGRCCYPMLPAKEVWSCPCKHGFSCLTRIFHTWHVMHSFTLFCSKPLPRQPWLSSSRCASTPC